MLRVAPTLLAVLTIAGCSAIGHPYVAPVINSESRFAGSPRAEPKSITADTSWWRAFKDTTLDRLVEQGLRGNLTVAQAVERVRAARASAALTGANAMPSGSTMAQASVSGSSLGSDVQASAALSSSFNWEIDLFGKLARQREAALASLDATIAEAAAARLSLIGEIVRNYLLARGYQDRLQIARSTLDSLTATLNLTRRQNEAGLSSALDLAQLEGDVATTRASMPTLEVSLAEAEHRLAVLLGQRPDALAGLFATPAQIPRASASVRAGVPANLMRDRPDIRQAERLLAAATSNIGVAEADLYPSLSLPGSLTIASATTWSLGASLSLPIFNRGKLKATVLIEQSEARQAFLTYRDTVLRAVEEVENALVGITQQTLRRQHLAKGYESYRQAKGLAEQRYAAGETSLLNYLTAQRSLYSARDSLAQSTVDLGLRYVALSLALGGGWNVPDGQV